MRNFPMTMLLDGGISSLFPNGSVTDSHGDIIIAAADADEIFCREAAKSADHSLGIVNRYYLHDFRGGIAEDKLQPAPFAGGFTTTLQTLNSYNLSINDCRKLHTDANGSTYSYGDAGAWSAQKLEGGALNEKIYWPDGLTSVNIMNPLGWHLANMFSGNQRFVQHKVESFLHIEYSNGEYIPSPDIIEHLQTLPPQVGASSKKPYLVLLLNFSRRPTSVYTCLDGFPLHYRL